MSIISLVPKSIQENLDYRRWVLNKCSGDLQARESFLEACRKDPIFWVNTFVWQYNPTKEIKAGPFVSWDYQDQAIEKINWCIDNKKDLVFEKSRDMGASWIMVMVAIWRWQFKKWQKLHFISRSEAAVESDDPDSLFWKADFILSWQPSWMTPKTDRKKKFFGNRSMRSSITGEATTGKAGVGGRATAMFIDEFAQIDQDFEVLQRTSDTTPCRIFNSTHMGPETAFNKLCERKDIAKLQMHWTQHPEKSKGLYKYDHSTHRIRILDKEYKFPEGYKFQYERKPTGGPFPYLRSPWYDEQCVRKGDARAIAIDLDIDPRGSVDIFFDQLVIQRISEEICYNPVWTGSIEYDLESGEFVRFIRDKKGPIKMWLHLDKDDRPPRAIYVGGIDIALGTGQSDSCLSICNARTGVKVLEFSDNTIPVHHFARLCAAIGRVFCDSFGTPAKLSWEGNGPGGNFGRAMTQEICYPNVYMRNLSPVGDPTKSSDVPGWYNTPTTKYALLLDYKIALQDRKFINPSFSAVEECLAFRYGKSKAKTVEHAKDVANTNPSGSGGNHGDIVIADAQAWMLAKDYVVGKQSQDEVQAVLPGSLAERREIFARQREEAESWG